MSTKTAEPVLFRETNASGRSLKSWVTKYGGATGCLNLSITETNLFVCISLSSIGLFRFWPKKLLSRQEQAIIKQSDLSHHIPKLNIISVTVKRKLWQRVYEIQYQDTAGDLHRLELMPKRCSAFERALDLPLNASR